MLYNKFKMNSLPSPEQFPEQNQVLAETIKSQIKNRFGKLFDPQTEEIKEIPYKEINLRYHCGEIAEFTAKTVGGKIEEHQAKGNNPSISYVEEDGEETEIASGFTITSHRYVVDENGMVWDPITNNWGNLTEGEYRQRLINNQS